MGPIRVLHVDDEPAFLELAVEYLERADDRITVETATDADQALDHLDGADVDCVVSDYEMPGADGLELLETVRERDDRLPFVLFTGKGSEEIASEAISAGVTDYLQKGTDPGQYAVLANRIENAVAQARTREYFSTILEQASDFVMVVDGDGHVEYVSPAVERVLGYTPAELMADSAFDYVHPEDLEIAGEGYADVLERPGEERTVEYRAEHADGGWRWLEVRGRNLLDDPIIGGVVVTARDVTGRKERERRLERQNERLDEVVTALSGDLRTPLNVAEGYLELAREEGDGEHLAEVARAHDRIARLVKELLSLARAGEPVEEPERVDLAANAEACWRDIETAAATLTVEADRVVEADRERFRQLLANLIENAVAHGSRGPGPHARQDGVEHSSQSQRSQTREDAVEDGSTRGPSQAVEDAGDVTVTVGGLPDGFYVADDGPGIPEDERATVFERGYSTHEGGTGFGLAIVNEVADAHGWDVTVRESAAGGARFEVTGIDVAPE